MSSLCVLQPLQVRFILQAEGFTFSSRMTAHGPMLSMDSDYIHNIKKLINVLASCVRSIRIGEGKPRQSARQRSPVSILEIVRANFTKSEHGLSKLHLDRKGYAAMDFPSALRLFSPKMLKCIQQCINGDGGNLQPLFWWVCNPI